MTTIETLVLDQRSLRLDLLERGQGLLEVVRGIPPKNLPRATPIDPLYSALRVGANAQPVFEQVNVPRIPTGAIVLGLDGASDATEARRLLHAAQEPFGLKQATPLRRGMYTLEVEKPQGGRVFEIAWALASHPGVTFAEPAFASIVLGTDWSVPQLQDQGFLARAVSLPFIETPPGGLGGWAERGHRVLPVVIPNRALGLAVRPHDRR